MRSADEKCMTIKNRKKGEVRLLLLARLVGLESTRWRELTKLMTNHVFRHINRQEAAAIVNVEVETDEIRSDGGAAGPSLDRLAITIGLCCFDLLCQVRVYEETFF